MALIAAQNIIIVAGRLGIQSRVEGDHAGTGDGAGGQALVEVSVIGAVHVLIVGLSYHPAGDIGDGGVDLEIARRLILRVVQTVINDRGNIGLVGAVSLLFNK